PSVRQRSLFLGHLLQVGNQVGALPCVRHAGKGQRGSSLCSTAFRFSRWIFPVLANSGSCPLGSVWTWSPISSLVTGAAVPLRVGQVCHAATVAAPAPYRNARRCLDGPPPHRAD